MHHRHVHETGTEAFQMGEVQRGSKTIHSLACSSSPNTMLTACSLHLCNGESKEAIGSTERWSPGQKGKVG
jgi:hypothetical protein